MHKMCQDNEIKTNQTYKAILLIENSKKTGDM